MKKFTASVILILLFISFAGFQYIKKSEKTVLKVLTPTLIQVDLNNNKISDEGETICINGVKSFTSDITRFDSDMAKSIGLSVNDSLTLGYLADEFADKTLSDQKVKVKFNGEKNNECRFADLYLNNQNYAEKLNLAGFGIVNGKPYNKINFNKNLKKSKTFKLVILNHHSNKFHNLDCKYGLASHDAVIIFQKQLPADALPCKYCHITKIKNHKKYKTTSFINYPLAISSGNIKLFLTDFTSKLKPDNKCDSLACIELVKQINMTNSSIDIALYGYDNIPKVTEAIKSAQNRGVKIRLIYDETANGKIYYNDTPMLAHLVNNSKSDKSEISVETAMLMHNKFMVFDNQRLVTGSMNFSRTGLSGFNCNTFVVISSKEIAQQYTDEFNQMFSGKFHKHKSKLKHTKVKLGSTTVTPLFSPQDNIIFNSILPLINNSNKYIYMPVFIITHYDLTDALIAAKNRGVDVKIIIDATNTQTCSKQLKKLRNSGVAVKTENYAGKMHSKSIIIDDKYIVTGSMNFSKSGESKNDENVLLIEDVRLAKFYKGFFEYIWKKIPNRYLKYNVRSESKYSIGSCSDGIDNNFDGKIDKDDVGCK